MFNDEKANPEDQEQDELEEGETCDQEGGCEEDEKPQPAKADAKKAAAPAKPATPAATGTKYLFPFFVRYASEILDLMGFVDGQDYTVAQIKELLIQNGFTEFRDMDFDLHRNEATNTLVITIRGSKKGADHD